MSMRELKTKKEIIDGLKHIDKSQWIKPLDSLIDDTIHKKEYRLFINTKTLEVETNGIVVSCEITSGNQRLVELEQRFFSGKVSNRMIPCSGKITISEKPEIGMIREMSEELEIDYKFLEGELKDKKIVYTYTEDKRVPSTFYPGITSAFKSINYAWEMPLSHYKTTYIERDSKKISTFGWVPIGTNIRSSGNLNIKTPSKIVYHGTTIKGLTVLEPRPSRVLNGESAVFATSNEDIAICFLVPWTDNDFTQGSVNGQLYIQERQAGNFIKFFKGKSGTIYSLDAKTFRVDPRLTRYELISKTKQTVISSRFIPDAWVALQKTSFDLYAYGTKLPWE